VRPAFIDKDELLLVVGGDGLTPGGARLLVAPARRACSSPPSFFLGRQNWLDSAR
jgi:hypothetical protein